MIVLKLGGSLLTHRLPRPSYDQATVVALARVIARAEQPLVIVHGMGSIGRAYLHHYDGRTIPAGRERLARELQLRLRALHHRVAADLKDNGVNVRSFDPESIFRIREGEIAASTLDLVRDYLASHYFPVLHGGTFADDVGHYTIVSSDQMAEHLVQQLGARTLVWATDVDGVLDSHRHRVIHRLSDHNAGRMWRQPYDRHDPTGGMTSKVSVSLRVARAGCRSIIVNGRYPQRVAEAIAGGVPTGTLVDDVYATGFRRKEVRL